jgi:hypothetical protein
MLTVGIGGLIGIDRKSWEQGVRDGAALASPPGWACGLSKGPGRDAYSYNSGYLEGEAYRWGYEVSMYVAEVCRAAPPTVIRGGAA